MSLYQCEKCGCVENTAVGHFWARSIIDWPPEYKDKKLCSECGPSTFPDGKPTEYGKWHGKFEKRSAAGMLIDNEGFLWSVAAVERGAVPKHKRIVATAK